MKAIVAVDKNWGIGFKGQLLERVSEDMKFFKGQTLGKIVVMGRETLESLPGGKPLKDRTNIVLSRSLKGRIIAGDTGDRNSVGGNDRDDRDDRDDKDAKAGSPTEAGFLICGSIEELLEEVKKYPGDDVIIIGGASVYKQMLPYCSEVYVTKFPNEHPADAYYPNLDLEQGWRVSVINGELEWNGLQYSRVLYSRVK
ncbi:MAG: dihydrofolate reductase [Clostridiales bacterium]|nr:dihydrofolate reductase [Clostridiales bacterium]